MDATEVRHVEQERRYELVVGGEVASVVGYDRTGDTVVLLHTGTEPAFRGHGCATQLVAAVLADLREQEVRVIARCPFVRWYLSLPDRATSG